MGSQSGVSPTVSARHAASLLVVRERPDGPEVLMGVRGRGHRFMPNRLVFPGGALDRTDAAAPAASEPGGAVLAALGRQYGPRLAPGMARGLACCAARELEEETGLSLGRPPRLAGLRYLCRAVTPPRMPIRFNARFLVVDAAETEGTPGDSDELSAVGFRPAARFVDEGLALVTAEVLRRFLRWHALPQALKDDPAEFAVFRQERWSADGVR